MDISVSWVVLDIGMFLVGNKANVVIGSLFSVGCLLVSFSTTLCSLNFRRYSGILGRCHTFNVWLHLAPVSFLMRCISAAFFQNIRLFAAGYYV